MPRMWRIRFHIDPNFMKVVLIPAFNVGAESRNSEQPLLESKASLSLFESATTETRRGMEGGFEDDIYYRHLFKI